MGTVPQERPIGEAEARRSDFAEEGAALVPKGAAQRLKSRSSLEPLSARCAASAPETTVAARSTGVRGIQGVVLKGSSSIRAQDVRIPKGPWRA